MRWALVLIVAGAFGQAREMRAEERTSSAPAAAARGDRMAGLYSGRTATCREELKAFAGEDAWRAIVGENRRKAYRLNFKQLGVNYGETVDFQLRREQVLLCPQTAELLYGLFTPRRVRYITGSRPELERVVREVTGERRGEFAKALALMRYCRDLYRKEWPRDFSKYVYGGTEEQLVAKGEILCECLGRLLVGLCEVAGMPGRVVMHDVGGHIAAEILVDGRWAYLDPTTGVYCVKPDGSPASTWEIWQAPELLEGQGEVVRADISGRWTWEQRLWKCRRRYFHPEEVTGFENYSLADADRYSFAQRTQREATEAGLFVINKEYEGTANEVFGLAGDGYRMAWEHAPLRRIPIVYRHDGFSPFFYLKPPMTRAWLEETFINPFERSNVSILEWGLGPGSVFCYDTKVGQVFGAPLTEAQWKLMREGDRWVYENVTALIRAGADPLRVAVERGHAIGRKVFARLEMNHEYGPAKGDNWMWVGLVGDLNKQHPEFRIPGHVFLDFKHREVRDFKIAIFREAAEAGVDGISMDFAVYPPYFEKPDGAIMTQFLRDVRAMLDEVGKKQNRRIEMMARVPYRGSPELGLNWQEWMTGRLVDIIVPTHYRPNETFDVDVDEFVSLGHQTGVRVYPCLWQALGFVDTDEQPGDEKKAVRRYDKPKTKEMFFAQAMMFHRAAADGLQLGFAAAEWNSRPWLNDLAEPGKVEFTDKHYMVDPKPHCPVKFPAAKDGKPESSVQTVSLRIGDDAAKAKKAGYEVEATVVLYARSLSEGEELSVCVNGQGPAKVRGNSGKESAGQASADPQKAGYGSFVFDPNWWKRGELRAEVPAEVLRLGKNEIRLEYRVESPEKARPLSITWVDLLIRYRKAG